jgi:CRP-like cAMP-binding protein
MFFLVEGAVVLYAGQRPPTPNDKGIQQDKQGSNVGAVDLAAGERIAGNGDVFGEGGLFPEELGPIRLESAKALSFVSAYVLTAASLREIEAEFPAVYFLVACDALPSPSTSAVLACLLASVFVLLNLDTRVANESKLRLLCNADQHYQHGMCCEPAGVFFLLRSHYYFLLSPTTLR